MIESMNEIVVQNRNEQFAEAIGELAGISPVKYLFQNGVTA